MDLRELRPGYWAADRLADRDSNPLPRLRDCECCLTPALSGPRSARPARRGRENLQRDRGAHAQRCPGPLQREVRRHSVIPGSAVSSSTGLTSGLDMVRPTGERGASRREEAATTRTCESCGLATGRQIDWQILTAIHCRDSATANVA